MTTSISPPNPVSNRLEDLCGRVNRQIYRPVSKLEMQAWLSSEPLPFASRTEGSPVSLHVGSPWGKKLFDCAWFRFRSKFIPDDYCNPVLRIDVNGELCIFTPEGVPFRGLTCVRSEFDRLLGRPGKTICRIETWMVRNNLLEVWADAGFNDLFGKIPGDGTITLAEIAECREDIRSLYYDLEVLRDLHDCSPGNPSLQERIAELFMEVEQCLGDFSAASITAARKALREAFSPRPNPSGLGVWGIGHAHIDLAWLWPIRETIRKATRTLSTVLYNMDRYPEYVFGCSQPQLFDWIKKYQPGLYTKVRKAVLAGKIEPQGTFWVEADCNIPSGESLVRQVLIGSHFFKQEFGIVPNFCWLPDVFGYNGQLPQILSKSGHRFFITQKLSWNVVNRFPYQSFSWEGIDGSRIWVHMLPEETYNGPAAPRSLRKIEENYLQSHVSSHALMAFGIGDGGGGPDAEHLERIRREGCLSDLPLLTMQTTSSFLNDWVKEAHGFPNWKGELYLERHQGTLTTQALTKKNNRTCEILLREAEWLGFLGQILCDHPYPVDFLTSIWKEVLLYQFHDILPGSSIRRVYEESNERYVHLIKQLQNEIENQRRRLADRISPSASHTVLNSLPWERKEWIKIEDTWHYVTVPAMGYHAWSGNEGGRQRLGNAQVHAEKQKLENEKLRVLFAEDGSIASMLDKTTGRELIGPNRGNRFVAFRDTGDAWDFAQDLSNKNPWLYLQEKALFPKLAVSRAWVDGPRAILEQKWLFQNSTILQQISLDSGSNQLAFETKIDWQEKETMLRVLFSTTVVSSKACFEIPFGSIERPTDEDSSVSKAQHEVAAHQWMTLAGEDFGVALLNDCKYGFRVKGSTINMNILRSVPHPGGALIGKEDTLNGADGAVFTDLGHHAFRYALMPVQGTHFEGEITAAARAFNHPLQVISKAGIDSTTPDKENSFMTVSNTAIDVSAVKRSEDKDGWVIRLCNASHEPQRTVLKFGFQMESLVETDLTEKTAPGAKPSLENQAVFSFGPFEVKTIKFKPRLQDGLLPSVS